ncbi:MULTISPECIES: hypothetical protein [unclassified Lentimonas]|uniref:hypothetical protein n=1 Tax=unclassified Lentimonas TaxID=2630993 RepID=UPI0013246165|nr:MULTISPECIES: hypothetical protein [unclassified Lentimonas]CAA6677250.1 Unannotated [Lentimonas sp. CC4]CAA6686125.1 Unannotated [Lentimonas sp. CC6]CAA7074157.1 Unannotated [Lentimonas sp. CC4]CAA7171515.1 Unannotated [Lentimonas sp. CC21]CAA7181993.1 Unannotated [Lentimonas sp. CC8]
MKESIRDAFRYYAPGAISYDQIFSFLDWQNKTAQKDEIRDILDVLLKEEFICRVGEGFQISSANRDFLDRNKQ